MISAFYDINRMKTKKNLLDHLFDLKKGIHLDIFCAVKVHQGRVFYRKLSIYPLTVTFYIVHQQKRVLK